MNTHTYIYIIYIYLYAFIHTYIYAFIHTYIYAFIFISHYITIFITRLPHIYVYIFMISLVLFYCGVKTQRLTLLTHRCNKSQLQGHLNHPLGYLQRRKTSICFFVDPKISYIYIYIYIYI